MRVFFVRFVFFVFFEQAITSAHHRRNCKSKFYRMGSRSHSNLALTGHLGQLSPPQLRVMSLQNQQPALGAADASIDQIHLSQKSLHFFCFVYFCHLATGDALQLWHWGFFFLHIAISIPCRDFFCIFHFCDLLSAPSSSTWFSRRSHLICRRGRCKMTVTFWYSEKLV